MKDSLTPAEWTVMTALWEKSPMTLSEVIAQIGDRADWSYRTYASYLTILLKKGVVEAQTRYRDKLYSPAVTKEECLKAESCRILTKIQDNSVKELVLNMVRGGNLGQEDRQELIAMLEAMDKEESHE